MKIKICGMKFPENILAIASLDIDFMGFIFYPKSPRFIDEMDKNILEKVPSQIKKVGVFVNEDFKKMIDLCRFYEISTIQLHGEEKPSECKKLKNEGFTLIKVFSIDEDFNFGNVEPYQKVCDYFLFDTKGKKKVEKVSHSHGIGIRKYVDKIALASFNAGADGLIIEIHHEPEIAYSDGQQTLNFEEFQELVHKINILKKFK